MRTKLLTATLLLTLTLSVSNLAAQEIETDTLLTLENCRTLALEHNKELQITQKKYISAQARKKVARSAFFPKIDAKGAYVRTFKELSLLQQDLLLPVIPIGAINPKTGTFDPALTSNPKIGAQTFAINPQTGKPMVGADGKPLFKNYTYIPSDAFKMDKHNMYVANISLIQPIFTGFKIVEMNKIANYAEKIAEQQVTLGEADLISETDKAYWLVMTVGEKVKLAQEYRKLLERLVNDLENYYAEGIITKNDLLKAQVKLNDAKLKELKAKNGFDLSKMALGHIIGIPHEKINLCQLSEEDLKATIYQLPNENFSERAEIAMLKNKVSMTKSGVNIARSKFMPDIALTAGYTMMNPNPYKGFKDSFGGDWSIGVVVRMPIFTWGERTNALRSSRMDYEAAQLELKDASEKIDIQTQQARYRYTESIHRAELTHKSREQAKENLRVSNINYEEGMLKLTELLEAQVMWEQASSEYIDAIAEVHNALTELEKVTGALYHYETTKNK